MTGDRISGTPVRFGKNIELDPCAYELRRAGRPLKLERIPMELLLLLVEHQGRLVSREQIIERVWGKGVFLDADNSINAAIRKIRQILKDDPERPQFVQTVIGKGYRFIAPLEENLPAPADAPRQSQQAAESLVGQKVSHYRVLQMLGGGGMGIVYKAEDLKLARPVALKFLPSELASDPVAFERLQREARAASALDHPNICSIYQLGEHEGQPFIVMQFLEGETLREWIERAAARNPKERVKELTELAVQIADGLKAAHQKGVIHRDIKPTNIFITNGGRAKILDFGVAKFMDAAGLCEQAGAAEISAESDGGASVTADPHLTRTGVSVGTPSYLAPEQIRREQVDARTDLFSFGVVLYEMATGQRAFSGNTGTVISNAVLNLPVVAARRLNPGLPSWLERVIDKSLEREPERRYQTAAELRADLLRFGAQTPQRSRWRLRIAAGVVGLIFAAAGLLLLTEVGGLRKKLLRHEAAPELAAQFKPRPSVAVLGFKNLSGIGEEAWISTALSEMLAAEVAAGQQIRVIPAENVARMKLDLSLTSNDSYGKGTLTKIHNHLNADIVLLGSYLALGKASAGKVRLDLQLQDTRNGETLTVISREGTETELAELVARSGADLRQQLGVGEITAHEALEIRAAVPENLEAARLYSQGLTKLEKFDALGAQNSLEKAIAADPNYALSHSALAQAWSALGYDAKAAAEAKKALDLSTNLSREQRLTIEGNYHEFSRDLPAAIESYRTLSNFFPDSLEYGLHLAALQTKNLGKDALQTIARMRSLPNPARDDPRIDYFEARAAGSLGNFHLALESAHRAAAKARVQNARMLLAEALWSEGFQSDRLGDFAKAEQKLTEARDLAVPSGNPLVLAGILRNLGILAYDRGDFAGARKPMQESLSILRRIGARRQEAQASVTFGNILYDQGKLEEAKRYYDDALRIDREIASPSDFIGSDLGSIANVLDGMGNLVAATRMQEASLLGFHEGGDKRGEADTLCNLGNVLAERGELGLAQQRYDQAIAIAQEIGYKDGLASYRMSSADVYLAQDRLTEARDRAQQSITLHRQMGASIKAAEGQFELAEIALEQGQLAEAETLVRAVVPEFEEQSKSDFAIQATALLARLLLIQSKIAESRAAADRALARSQQATDFNSHFAAGIASALVTAAEGRTTEAVHSLETMRAESGRHGYAGWEFEARLHLGELELHSGKAAAGRVHLEQLQADARHKGFLLAAHKAAGALNNSTLGVH